MERSIGHRAPVLWLLLPTMGGFALARALPVGWGGAWWLSVAVLGLGLAVAGIVLRSGAGPVLDRLRRAAVRTIPPGGRPATGPTRRRGGPARPGWGDGCWALGLVLAVGGAAVVYFQLRENRLAVWDGLPPREAELVLAVERVFPRVPGRVTTTGLARIVAAPPLVAETVGQRVFFAVQLPDAAAPVVVSERLRARGVLGPLDRRKVEGFDGYLASAGVAFKFNRARWVGRERPANAYRVFCAGAAERFEAILGAGLVDRPGLRAVLVAMLLGRRAELDGGRRELFLNSGTMHLFAVSGLHIGVIWAVLAILLEVARVPRRAGVVVGLAVLWLHVQITGGSPSAVRAWLMIAFVVGARALRWTRNPLAGIAASALVVLWWEPWQLFGLGFRMSYSVVAALLLYGLVLDERWQRYWRPWVELPAAEWRWWHRVVRAAGKLAIAGAALSVAATLVSLPFSVALFGVLTPGALVVNLICIPLASLVIMAGVGSVLAGLVGLGPLSVLFNHAAAVVIAAIERLLGAAVAVPGVYWPAQFRAEWLGTAVLLVLLVVLAAGYARRWRPRWVLWVPVAVLVVGLALGVRSVAAGAGGAETAAPVGSFAPPR